MADLTNMMFQEINEKAKIKQLYMNTEKESLKANLLNNVKGLTGYYGSLRIIEMKRKDIKKTFYSYLF